MRVHKILVVIAALAVVLPACQPDEVGTPSAPHIDIVVTSGSTASGSATVAGAGYVATVDVPPGLAAGVRATGHGSFTGQPPVAAIVVDVAVDAGTAVSSSTATVAATGCTTQAEANGCPAGSEWTGTATLTVTVIGPTTAVPDKLLLPSTWSANADGTWTAPGIVEMFVDDSVTAAQVSTAAASLAGVVVGADAATGVYWLRVADVPAAVSALLAIPGVYAAQPLQSGQLSTEAAPSELAGMNAAQSWTFSQAGVTDAWTSGAPGGSGVMLGVIDRGLYPRHPDLAPRIASYDTAGYNPAAGWARAGDHGTHVAGIMCANGNNGDTTVGVNYSCGLRALDLADAFLEVDGNVISWPDSMMISEMRDWLARRTDLRVVNMSFGFGSTNQPNCNSTFAQFNRLARLMKTQVFDRFPNVLFVVSAGNCAQASKNTVVPGGSVLDPLWRSDNVLSVSSTARSNGGARLLSAFSNRDGLVAAPGGGATTPVVSTGHGSCSAILSSCLLSFGNDVEQKSGTSMAAPFVSGIAGLMLSVTPTLSMARLKTCLIDAAITPIAGVEGAPGVAVSVKEIWAPEAMACSRASSSSIASGEPACAVISGGKVMCWGPNRTGRLGNGTNTASNRPVEVLGVTGATAVSASATHACALLASGTVKCWGEGTSGQLGNGGFTDRNTPVDVLGVTGATQISVGGAQSCARLAGGKVNCWGGNSRGQLGNGLNASSATPVEVKAARPAGDTRPPDPLEGVVSVATQETTTCAVLGNGGVRCWGHNNYGQLGNGTTVDSNLAVPVSGVGGATAVDTAGYSCAVVGGGAIKCWGHNVVGQLGDRTTTNSSTPVDVQGLSGATSVSIGSFGDTCAVITGGTVKCWGLNSNGQLGDGTRTNSLAPVQADVSGVTAVSAGIGHTCALLVGGWIQCWGANLNGDLGHGTNTSYELKPVFVVDLI